MNSKFRMLVRQVLTAAPATVGGQAVLEGVMMRGGCRVAIALRKADGTILVEERPWVCLGDGLLGKLTKTPYLRGFPVLVETLVNGLKALSFSASQAVESESEGESELSGWALTGTMLLAVVFSIGLFVVLPHLLSLCAQALGLGGAADSVSFQIWDGFFKLGLFLAYIVGISRMPDIRRVFQYHGAEHKVIWAHESGKLLTPEAARAYSRLHPRCGTTFLLVVMTLAIVLHAALVPLLLAAWSPESSVLRQMWVVFGKILMMIPVSCLAYEFIRLAGKRQDSFLLRAMGAPGLALQRLTTCEPDDGQLEVAIAALQSAVQGAAQPHTPCAATPAAVCKES